MTTPTIHSTPITWHQLRCHGTAITMRWVVFDHEHDVVSNRLTFATREEAEQAARATLQIGGPNYVQHMACVVEFNKWGSIAIAADERQPWSDGRSRS